MIKINDKEGDRMTFEQWWKQNGKDFSQYAIPDEIKWFAEKAWNAATAENTMDCPKCGDPYPVLHCEHCGHNFNR